MLSISNVISTYSENAGSLQLDLTYIYGFRLSGPGNWEHFEVDYKSFSDYYPYGMLMVGLLLVVIIILGLVGSKRQTSIPKSQTHRTHKKVKNTRMKIQKLN